MNTTPGGTKTVGQFYRQSTDETYGEWVDVRGSQNVCVYLTSFGTTSGGTIAIEEAAPEDVSVNLGNAPVFGAAVGNYSLITTINASDFTGTKQEAVHLQSRAYYFVRARIATAITGGGSVSAGVVAY